MGLERCCDCKFSAYDSVGPNVTEFAPLFLYQSPDSAPNDEGSGLAIVPRHQVSLRHLTMPHFRAKRRCDRAVRAVDMGIAVLGIDLLDPSASPYRGGKLQCMGASSEHY
jgi:hypothetical protein